MLFNNNNNINLVIIRNIFTTASNKMLFNLDSVVRRLRTKSSMLAHELIKISLLDYKLVLST
jgi:hypothetical protein